MSYPFGVVEFGLPVMPARERELGPIDERNLRELFQGSADWVIPDQLVDLYKKDQPHASDFGLHRVGYTEYMACRYVLRVENFYLPGVGSFEPDEIQCVDPEHTLERFAAALATASKDWQALLARVQPTELLWLYLTTDGVPAKPQLLQLTLSN